MDNTKLAYFGVGVNVALFWMKLWAGTASGSIAAVSDALNSLLDVFSYTALSIAVWLHNQEPDEDHPFGHRRAEPLAGFIIAIVAAILGGTIIKDAIVAFIVDEPLHVTSRILMVLIAAVVIKAFQAVLYYAAARRSRSKALMAGFIDARNDILSSLVVFIGVFVGGRYDELAALFIGAWILFSGIRIGMENAGYLMSRAADPETIAMIEKTALAIAGVKGIDEIRAHFVGDRIHADVHIEVDSRLSVGEAHDISEQVKWAVDALPEIDNTFVHVDLFVGDNTEKEKEFTG